MIYRIDVRTTSLARSGEAALDPVGEAIRQQIKEFSPAVGAVETSRIFLIDTDAPVEQVRRVANELLADPIVEQAELILDAPADSGRSRIEIHLKAGVMDPVAASTEMAVRDMGIGINEVRTGRSYVICDPVDEAELKHIAARVLANGVIESVHLKPFIPKQFEHGREDKFQLRHVPIRELTEPRLAKLSREGHLFLSIPEMKGVQDYFRKQNREPTDIELETIAQTWSEHCVHKTLKSAVEIEVRDETGKVIGHRRYGNLIRDTIFQSTIDLIERRRRDTGVSPVQGAHGTGEPASPFSSANKHGLEARVTTDDFCLSVFKDNAGVIAFDETDAVCFKVETHNHPSAIEPYGGAATGIGGCIRDVLGTGLAARPIANTNVFCVAFPDRNRVSGKKKASSTDPKPETRNPKPEPLPKGVIHPKRVLQQVVAGVRDYGNRMGIPTVNGAVYFDDRYIGNPLVFAGCVGIIPRDRIHKESKVGDAIVVMGGRTGRDGIHGATFSSAELTDTHADEFSHAVQIGNAITQKKMADVILQARDRGLFSAITDLGAGGLSSAIGEMGETVGASVNLETVPLKYAGLRYDEIWISEAQERMALSVPQEHVAALLELAASEDVEATVIGTFGTEKQELVLSYRGTEVGRMAMHFLHKGIPMPTRKAIVVERSNSGSMGVPPMHGRGGHATSFIKDRLLKLLAHPNIASKHWIIRQYDHEVQGGSVIKPLLGPEQIGPSDAAVVRPKLSSMKGVAIGCGLAPQVTDPYDMAIAAIDEAVRNVVCVGADPDKIAILDNFCWPSVDDEYTMGTLVRACEACRDAALAYGIPFISGKDSLHNQFTNSETGDVIRIPNTLLISAIGVIDDVERCVTMDLKNRTARVVLVSANDARNLATLSRTHRLVSGAIRAGFVAAAHDVSDGGVPVALAEMCIASGLGLIVGEEFFTSPDAFEERPGRYLLELTDPGRADELRANFAGVADVVDLGLVQHLRKLMVTSQKERVLEIGLDELTAAWRGTLDW